MATSRKANDRLKVECSCGAKLMAPKKAVGRRVKCPRCKRILTVPDPGSTADRMIYRLADEEYNKPAMEEQPPPPEPTRTERGTKLCPNCNGEMAGDAVFCIKCGFHLERGVAVTVVPAGSGHTNAAHSSGGLVAFLTEPPSRMMEPPDWKIGLAACIGLALLEAFIRQGAWSLVDSGFSVVLTLLGGAVSALILVFAYKIATSRELELSQAFDVELAMAAALTLFILIAGLIVQPGDDNALSLPAFSIAMGINFFVIILAYRMFLGLPPIKAILVWLIQAAVRIGLFIGLVAILAALLAGTGLEG